VGLLLSFGTGTEKLEKISNFLAAAHSSVMMFAILLREKIFVRPCVLKLSQS